MRPSNIPASQYLEIRSELLSMIQAIDAEIDNILQTVKRSNRAAAHARELFHHRSLVAAELKEIGVEVEPHPATAKK